MVGEPGDLSELVLGDVTMTKLPCPAISQDLDIDLEEME